MADKPRILNNGKDMLMSLLVLLILVVFVVITSRNCSIGLTGGAADDKIPPFEVSSALRADASTMPFPIRQPALPAGWKPNSGTSGQIGGKQVSTVGWITPGGYYLGLSQSDATESELLPTLLADAAGLALVSFSSMMLTAQSFAEKNRYSIDTDREFIALGLANMASSFSQGFAISGADSRTAVADSSGGRTQMTSVIAALAIALVLLFFTAPLAYVPVAALGVVLLFGALSLVNLQFLAQLYRISRVELALCLLATVGVVAVGAIQAILLVVVLALLRFVHSMSRPLVEELGRVEGMRGFHALQRHATGARQPGMLLFRFNAPLVFFNANYFRQQVERAVERAGRMANQVLIFNIKLLSVGPVLPAPAPQGAGQGR